MQQVASNDNNLSPDELEGTIRWVAQRKGIPTDIHILAGSEQIEPPMVHAALCRVSTSSGARRGKQGETKRWHQGAAMGTKQGAGRLIRRRKDLPTPGAWADEYWKVLHGR